MSLLRLSENLKFSDKLSCPKTLTPPDGTHSQLNWLFGEFHQSLLAGFTRERRAWEEKSDLKLQQSIWLSFSFKRSERRSVTLEFLPHVLIEATMESSVFQNNERWKVDPPQRSPQNQPPILPHMCSILLSATPERFPKNEFKKKKSIWFLFFSDGGCKRVQICLVFKAKVAAESEILKVTNTIRVEGNVVGNKLIAAEESGRRPAFSLSANHQHGARLLGCSRLKLHQIWCETGR